MCVVLLIVYLCVCRVLRIRHCCLYLELNRDIADSDEFDG